MNNYKKTACFILSMSSSAWATTTIPAVSITAQSTTNNNNNNYADETVSLNHQAIQASPNTQLSDVLKTQSVVRIANNSGNSYQSTLSIRGFGDNAPANSLIVVDGFPLINASLLAPNLNALLLSDIQKISIFPGSQGSLAGNQAVGGVLAIQTLHPQKAYGNLNISYGSYATPFLSALFADKKDNGFFYKVSAFGTESDSYRQHNHQSDSGVSLQEGIDYATGSITLNQKLYDATSQFPGSLTEAQYQTDPTQATDTNDYIHYRTQIYQLLSQQQLTPQWRLETRASTTQITSDGWFYAPFSGTESLNSINPQVIGMLTGNKITVGYVGQSSHYQELTADANNASAADSIENDLYAQAVTPISDQWQLTLGIRQAWQNNNPQIVLGQTSHYLNSILVTEQGINYFINKEWTWFLRRDGNFRLPKANEQVWLATDQTQLKPQTGVSYETGLNWLTAKLHYQLSFYELWLHNEIAYDPTQTEAQPYGATCNFAETLRKGMSFSADTPLTTTITLNNQFNYVDARFVAGANAGNVVPAVPQYTTSTGLSYQFAPEWTTRYSESYSGSAYASDDTANVGAKAAPYWLGQWSVQYTIKNSQISFQINNVFDQSYAAYTVYSQNSQSDSYYPAAGRNFLLSLKTQWA